MRGIGRESASLAEPQALKVAGAAFFLMSYLDWACQEENRGTRNSVGMLKPPQLVVVSFGIIVGIIPVGFANQQVVPVY